MRCKDGLYGALYGGIVRRERVVPSLSRPIGTIGTTHKCYRWKALVKGNLMGYTIWQDPIRAYCYICTIILLVGSWRFVRVDIFKYNFRLDD